MTDNVTPEQAQPYREAVNNASKFGEKLLKLKIPNRLVGLLMAAHLNIAIFRLKRAPEELIG